MKRLGIAIALLLVLAACDRRAPEFVPIAGGSFTAGAPQLLTRDNPTREVSVGDFVIMTYEVSVDDYAACAAAGRCGAIHLVPPFSDGRLPMTHLTWNEAQTYCRWSDMRLPTENEWERAARGPANTLYPWGESFDPDAANGGHAKACEREGVVYRFSAPAGCFARDRSGFGVFDLAGNVAEWTADVYSPVPGVNGDPELRVVKGGYFYAEPTQLSGAWREGAATGVRSPRIGFRCAKTH